MTALTDRDAEPHASALDAASHGAHRPPSTSTPEFSTRITRDATSGHPGQAGRYHLYTAATSPAAHRLEILRVLLGLEDVVSLSRVDGLRDGRGWAFRGPTGPDPVNGFTLLREAYDASTAGYTGDVSVPVLWDRTQHRIVSNDPVAIGVDLATQFDVARDVYPAQHAAEIERIGAAVSASFTELLGHAVVDRRAAGEVRAALRRMDAWLAQRAYLLGPTLTDADVRLWVGVVRFDVGVNAHGTVGPALPAYRHLWRWARDLYTLPAFGATTEFGAFAAPFTDLSHWAA